MHVRRRMHCNVFLLYIAVKNTGTCLLFVIESIQCNDAAIISGFQGPLFNSDPFLSY